ncbi:prolyl 4-hydroxylase [Niveomyces insectorum RCEF 264]|uniref:Prolyl 4-hydroxylase n=1 Tax=Niveomyces insectorum RCEF 264 TaxID=1081102 RepID=A0A162IFB7_9HYPO|nr:prolyl 4-hydroxylase [Niveomyces insectorum RCEF 264]
MSDLASLVTDRYGSPPAPGAFGDLVANHTLTTLLAHKSVRQFVLGQALPAGTLDVLVAAAQSAPTSSNLQTWSVVAVQDPGRKARLATLCGDQAFVRNAPLFLLFVADLHRLEKVAEATGQPPGAALAYTETFLIASLDAAFAAQNVIVAAEALGLGGCYVGAARNHPREVAELLGLPPRAVGLFGMALGVPDLTATDDTPAAAVKPRLPAAEVLHHERWDDNDQAQHFEAYDKVLGVFNASQQRADQPAWTARVTTRVATEAEMHGRHELRQILNERNFELK